MARRSPSRSAPDASSSLDDLFSVAQSRLVIHELLIGLFVLMTAPVVAMLIMRAAVYRDPQRDRSGEADDPGAETSG